MKRVALLTALAALAGLAALCASAMAAGRGPATISARHTALGTFLVSGGRTLYLFEADGRNQSTCTGPCAGTWPPLLTSGRPKASAGVKPGLLGTIRRGTSAQITYGGHALYTYSGDTKAADTNSQGLKLFGAKWFLVSVQGTAIAKAR
jgi:predicted lipoprotein with Yx(FWY)xxD motif